jgi:UPF0755 protein
MSINWTKISEKVTSRKILVLSLVTVLLAVLLIIVAISNSPKDRSGLPKDFMIKSGQTTHQIAENLQSQGFIKSSVWFLVYAKLQKGYIQAGVYKISAAESTMAICRDLIGSNPSEYYVTIPEGYRVTQIDALLAAKGIITAGEFTQVASSDEGYLFPDTYRFLPKSDPVNIRDEMLDNFNKKVAGMNLSRQDVIIASIVEREAKFDEDRPKIARVYLNRLAIGMKLEADPTIQYAKGSWDPIKASDYQNVDSSYNTYLRTGLPPGPICNPGLKSLQAVQYPDSNDYLYFFHKSDGHAVYSKTVEEHEQNLKNYRT